MPAWHNLVIPFVTAVFGFFLGVLKERLLEKKVSLSHKLDSPAVFSYIPPKICFQNLKILNKGKLPAKNIRVNLRSDVVRSQSVEYKPITEEGYTEETKGSVLTLKFERLLPKDELTISFKSSEPLPDDFLVSIKSEEMVSEVFRGDDGVSSSVANSVQAILAVAAVAVSLYALFNYISRPTIAPAPTTESKIPEKPKPASFEIHLVTDKPVYLKNQTMEVIYNIRNITGQTLRAFWVTMEIPGFRLDYDKKYKEKNFLGAEEEFYRKIPLKIPDDIPPGKYKIKISVRAESLDSTLTNESQAFFDVK